jgi:hypothetical protein
MAVDSIIANPTNNVLVMVGEASGCWAMEPNAFETALPSPIAGNIVPTAVVNPAVIIETTAISVRLSIFVFFLVKIKFILLL